MLVKTLDLTQLALVKLEFRHLALPISQSELTERGRALDKRRESTRIKFSRAACAYCEPESTAQVLPLGSVPVSDTGTWRWAQCLLDLALLSANKFCLLGFFEKGLAL